MRSVRTAVADHCATGAEVAATEAEITTAAAAITSDTAASTFPALIADGAEIFSGIGQFTKADAQILAIQALIVAMTSGDSAKDGGNQPVPAHPNDAVTEKMAELLRRGIDPNTDCSEIAEDLAEAANGDGNILRVEPPKGKLLDVEENGIREQYEYHEVYSDDKYVYDPRLSRDPIPKAEWEREIIGDNPGAKIRTTK